MNGQISKIVKMARIQFGAVHLLGQCHEHRFRVEVLIHTTGFRKGELVWSGWVEGEYNTARVNARKVG